MLNKLMAKLGYVKEPSKEPYPPVSQDLAATLAKALGEHMGKQMGVRVHHINTKTGEMRTSDSGEIPAPFSHPTRNSDSPPSMHGWKEYSEAMATCRQPGWAFGRIGCRSTNNVDVTFYFGLLRGDFGVFTVPMAVCYEDGHEPETEPSVEEPILAQLLHIPTGVGFGVFETRALACKAAEVLTAANLLPAQQEITPEVWATHSGNVKRLWAFEGIGVSERWHAHAEGAPYPLKIHTTIADDVGRPEKLS